MHSDTLTIDKLRHFNCFSNSNEKYLNTIIDDCTLSHAVKGEKIIELGDTSDFGYFLLEGKIILKAADGGVRTIEANSESSKNQIAQLLPRRYQVIAAESVHYLKIPNNLINAISHHEDTDSSIILNDVSSMDDSIISQTDSEYAFENEVSYQLYQDLKNDTLVLPSLPDIAVRVGRALNDEHSNARQIAEIAQTDTAIAAKLIRAANSAMYGGSSKVDSCSAAVVRLGVDLTHKLVMTFAVKDLFKSSSDLLNRRMKNLWAHSTKVAAISHVLAKKIGQFDPEHALLAGLVHDIGVLAIINYSIDFPEIHTNKNMLDNTIKSLRAQIGSMILRNWGFPEGIPEVAQDAENWMRSPSTQPDYSDLIIIAQLHSFIGTDKMVDAPPIDKVPAFNRLRLGKLTPKMSLKILDEAKEEIAEARALLSA